MTPYATRDGITLWHGDARHVSEFIAPESVDLIVTSPPYFALRSYTDGGEHYDGQIGSEPTPREFIDALLECTADWCKVLRPTGSMWVNLGDKYAGAPAGNITPSGFQQMERTTAGRGPLLRGGATRTGGIPAKSLMGLPWRYANRVVDEFGLILRAEIIWSKPNGLPESVTDRVRRSHEQWFHFTRQGRYYAAVDEVREAYDWDYSKGYTQRGNSTDPDRSLVKGFDTSALADPRRNMAAHRQVERGSNPLGKLPGSVWTIPSEPLTVPDHLGVDHFAAFPSEWPRRIILGWSPPGYCLECGQPRVAVVEKSLGPMIGHGHTRPANTNGTRTIAREAVDNARPSGRVVGSETATITGYACACPTPDAPTRPAVILDPFGGTGTVAAVARALGRHAHHVDLSNDYLRLAEWRVWHDDAIHRKASERSGIAVPEPPKIDGQLSLLDGAA